MIRANWTNAVSEHHELLPELMDPTRLALLKGVFSETVAGQIEGTGAPVHIPTKSAGVSDPNQPPVPSEASRAFR